MAPLFSLRTLGVPVLLASTGEAVRFRTRKHFALLVRLAVEPDRPLTRDHLIDLLWGSAPERHGRHSLAQAVTVLKAKIGRQHVLIHRSTIALAPGVVSADITRLDVCEGEIRGRFLEGFEVPGARAFEDWRDAWHARLLPRLRDCLVRHMDAARRVGDFATVEAHAGVLAELDPLSEDALRGIMEARAWVGDRSSALKAYAAFESRLANELGARPAPELSRIAHLLREGRRSPYRQPNEPPPEAGEKRFEPERVVGREREFSRLYDAWLSARRREPSVVVLTGDPGVGKTTLTNAFASTCQMEGAVVARTQAYDAERELPFAVLAELVRQLTIQRAIGAADPEALSELSRICADVVAAFPGVPKPVEWSAEITPLRLADAFLKTITAASDENPLVLVVDDIHAVDNASAAILHVVARKLPLARLILILTGRTSELRVSGAAQALAGDSSIVALRTLEIEPLSSEAAQRMIQALCEDREPPLPEGVKARVLAASSGNPLAIELLVREWQAHGAASLLSDLDRLNTLPAATLGIPRAIRAVFDRQVARLDRQTRSALDLAAVLGRRLSDLALYEAVEVSPAEAAEALSRLCDEGLLREVHGELEFRNELLRAQAYYAVAAVARQHLHCAVADLLWHRPPEEGDSGLLPVAWHFLRGGNWSKGSELGLKGAEGALLVGAPREAEQILSSISRSAPSLTEDVGPRVLLARALIDQSKADQAAPLLDSLRSRNDIPLNQIAQIRRMRASAMYLTETGGPDHAYRDAASEALAAARATNDKALFDRALFEYARSGVETGDNERVAEARSHLMNRTEEACGSTSPFLLYALGYCNYFSNDVALAAQCMERVIEGLRASPDLVLLSLAHNGLGIAREHLCDLKGAIRAFEAGLRVAERLGDDSRASIVSSNLCTTNMFLGDLPSAVRWGERSVALGKAALVQPLLGSAYTNLADAYLLTGNRTKALETIQAASHCVSQKGTWRATVLLLLDSAGMELAMGNTPRAVQIMTQCEEVLDGRHATVSDAGTYSRLKAVWAAHMHDDETAASIVAEAEKRFATHDPLSYLDALAAHAWIDRRTTGQVCESVLREIRPMGRAMPGKVALLAAQGFPVTNEL